MTHADLGQIAEGARPRQAAAERFRDSHHMLARLFASGLKASAVAAKSGFSINRVVTLHNDPAFQELITYYRKMVDEAYVENVDSYMELATGNMLKAERMIADKLDKADELGEPLPTRELVSISRDAADRFGYGKRETKFNVNVDFASALDRAIKRSGKIVDLRPVTPTLPPMSRVVESGSEGAPESSPEPHHIRGAEAGTNESSYQLEAPHHEPLRRRI